jgi:Fe-S-cluster containining protein
LFRITELDAESIEEGIRKLKPEIRDALRDRAGKYLEAEKTLPQSGRRRLPCPALVDNICTIYDFRPVLCHKFGMPLFNPDRPERILACELNFRDGEEIHDPDLIQIQTGIHKAWKQLQADHASSRGSGASQTWNVAAAILRDRPPLR